MAQTISGFQGTVSAEHEAQRLHRVRPPVADKLSDFSLVSSASGRVITIGPGSATVCGVRFTESADTSITLPANSAGATRIDIIGLRFDWAAGTVTLFSKRGTTTTTPPDLVRNPGTVYEYPLFGVTVASGATTISTSSIKSMLAVGGFGKSPFRINATDWAARIEIPVGGRIQLGSTTWEVTDWSGQYTTTQQVAIDPGPWPSYTPTLRAGNNFTAVNLGSGGVYRGYHHTENGYCHVKAEIRRGTSGDNMGVGFYSMDLPATPADGFTDTWGDGVLFTDLGGAMTWPIKILIRPEFGARGRLYAPTKGDDARFLPQGAIQSGGPGNGIPYVAGQNSVPKIIAFDFTYLIKG